MGVFICELEPLPLTRSSTVFPPLFSLFVGSLAVVFAVSCPFLFVVMHVHLESSCVAAVGEIGVGVDRCEGIWVSQWAHCLPLTFPPSTLVVYRLYILFPP